MPTPTLQELADRLAGRLRRSVTVVDPEIRILCASAHFGDEDDARVRAILQRVAVPEVYRHIHSYGVRHWTAAGHVPAARELGFKRRLVIPIRRGANLLALLMIIDEPDGELGTAELDAATRATSLMGEVLDRELPDAERRRGRSAEQLAALLSDHDVTREAALQNAGGAPIGPGDHVLVLTLLVRPSGATNPDQLSLTVEAGLRNAEMGEAARLAHIFAGQAATIAAATDAPPTPEEADALGRRVLRAVDSLLGDTATTVMGLPAGPVGPRELRRARRQSSLAAEAAMLLPRFRPAVAFPTVGVFSVLLRMPREELAEVVPDGLTRLLDDDPRGVLRETLDVYLSTAGSIPGTAERLSLHRTSLYYRLRQIEARLGMDLHDGEARQVVHLGLKAAELLDALRR